MRFEHETQEHSQPPGLFDELSDNDMDTPTYSCERAKILTVYDRHVQLTPEQRWRIFKMLSPPSEHPNMTRIKYDQMMRQALTLAATHPANSE
jgi:hypothetical protein